MKDFVVTKVLLEDREVHAACLFEDLRLEDLLVEDPSSASLVGGIYVGSLMSRAKETGGAFLRIGKDTGCFVKSFDKSKSDGGRVVVQVQKDAAGNKQAAATQELRLAGRYAVVSRREPGLSVSAKLPQAEKQRLRALHGEALGFLDCHVLLRTEAASADPETVRAEAEALRERLLDLLRKADVVPAGTCLQKPEPFFRRFFEGLSAVPDRLLTDLVFAEEPLRQLAAERGAVFAEKRPGSLPYAELYGLKTELGKLLGRCVHIKGGAELVIQTTEAFVSVDVNSAHFKGNGSSERNARRINEEAVSELFRQIRLRRLSGMILTDLINMPDKGDREAVLALAKEAAGRERVRTEAVDITPLGILEILREKSGPTLYESMTRGSGAAKPSAGFLRNEFV